MTPVLSAEEVGRLEDRMSQMFLWLPPYTEAWVNADTGEVEIREPYKVYHKEN